MIREVENFNDFFSVFSHNISMGVGTGIGFLATFNLERLHMLSYDV